MNNFLEHHGIKGQKWGVRRYQNPDGSLTEEGRTRQRARRRVNRFIPSTDDVNSIYRSMSKEQKKLISGEDRPPRDWISDEEVSLGTLTQLGMRYVQYVENIPVSFIEIWDNLGDVGQVAIGTRPEYQGKGLATKGAEFATNWFDKYGSKTLKELQWNALDTNVASIKTAKKAGFVDIDENDPSYTDAKGVHRLVYRGKKR